MHKIAEKEFTIDDFSHEHLDAINSIGTTNIITSEEMVNDIDSDTTTDAGVDYAVQMAKDAARHYSFEKEE